VLQPSELEKSPNSAGHRLGQIIGDWWERRVVAELLSEVATRLELFLDHRFVSRTSRSNKILWKDEDGNFVDYDFVLELEGSTDKQGIPVGFIECFWRGGARHSKDKARDDTNKLLPMRDTYPTARLLAIAACGEFTAPAREYVSTRRVDLFFMPKSKIIEAFRSVNVNIDYPDTLSEAGKQDLLRDLSARLTPQKEKEAALALRRIAGEGTFASFKSKVLSALSALPQEIRIIESAHSDVVVFENVSEVSKFLENPEFSHQGTDTTYEYSITYSDGFEFIRTLKKLNDVKLLIVAEK
jgi:hypothetical protein